MWLDLTEEEKRKYLYDAVNNHLYLILGSDSYIGIFRSEISDKTHKLLGSISMKYDSEIKDCKFYFPLELNQVIKEKEGERKLVDYWVEI